MRKKWDILSNNQQRLMTNRLVYSDIHFVDVSQLKNYKVSLF